MENTEKSTFSVRFNDYVQQLIAVNNYSYPSVWKQPSYFTATLLQFYLSHLQCTNCTLGSVLASLLYIMYYSLLIGQFLVM